VSIRWQLCLKTLENRRFWCPKNVQKKLKKTVDSPLRICDINSTHGNNRTKIMRTKILLSAIAALAVGVATSMAQTTYSQNIVGYANVGTPNIGQNYLITCPFKMGVSNGVNEVFSTALPDFSAVLVWDVGSQSYTTYLSDTGSASGWDDVDFNALTTLPTLPVGIGFFLNPSAAITNTFAGTIAVNVGTSNKMELTSVGQNYLVACAVPYAGVVTNGTVSGGGPNLNALPDFSALLVWDVESQSYTTSLSDTGSGSGWDDVDFNALPAPPSISVGQGFFINPSEAYTWTTGL
jgi:hypothetical protein